MNEITEQDMQDLDQNPAWREIKGYLEGELENTRAQLENTSLNENAFRVLQGLASGIRMMLGLPAVIMQSIALEAREEDK